jgi:acyl-coenzyme A thioesterase PaaI-like protein
LSDNSSNGDSPTSDSSDIEEARADAGQAIRDLGHALVGHVATTEQLEAATEDLQRLTTDFDTGTVRDRVIERPTGDWGPAPADGEEMTSFDERPVSGRSSPYGLDIRVVRDGDEVVAHVTLGAAHEGAPGRCHGGIISALFDDVFGFILTIHAVPAFTGELTVRYEQGVPLHQPLECRVRLSERDGRKIHMTGELTGDDGVGERTVYTRSRAIFIAIDDDAFAIRTE